MSRSFLDRDRPWLRSPPSPQEEEPKKITVGAWVVPVSLAIGLGTGLSGSIITGTFPVPPKMGEKLGKLIGTSSLISLATLTALIGWTGEVTEGA